MLAHNHIRPNKTMDVSRGACFLDNWFLSDAFTVLIMNFAVAGLWQEQIERRYKGMEADVNRCKTLDFGRGCISIQNQLVTFRHPA